MEFLLSLLVAFLVVIVGVQIRERCRIPGPLDRLRVGRSHYLLLGVLVGMAFPVEEALFRLFTQLRHGLVGAGLVWLGYQAGLFFDLRGLGQCTRRQLLAESVFALLVFLLAFVGVLAAGPLLGARLGVTKDLPLVALLLAAFSVTTAVAQPARWGPKRASPASSVTPTVYTALPNTLALALLAVAFPALADPGVIRLGPVTTVGYTGILAVILCLGLLLGIVLDFVYRANKEGSRCVYFTLGVLAFVGGPCTHLHLPGVVVGFLGGAWLINATVRRREVLELADRTGATVEPVVYILVGTIIGGYGGGLFFDPTTILPFAACLLALKVVTRMLANGAARRVSGRPRESSELLAVGFPLCGSLSAALVIQGLYLPLRLEHNTVLAGALLLVFLSQPVFGVLFREGTSRSPSPSMGEAN